MTIYGSMIFNSQKFIEKCKRSRNKTLVPHMICKGLMFVVHNESEVEVGTWYLVLLVISLTSRFQGLSCASSLFELHNVRVWTI